MLSLRQSKSTANDHYGIHLWCLIIALHAKCNSYLFYTGSLPLEHMNEEVQMVSDTMIAVSTGFYLSNSTMLINHFV